MGRTTSCEKQLFMLEAGCPPDILYLGILLGGSQSLFFPCTSSQGHSNVKTSLLVYCGASQSRQSRSHLWLLKGSVEGFGQGSWLFTQGSRKVPGRIHAGLSNGSPRFPALYPRLPQVWFIPHLILGLPLALRGLDLELPRLPSGSNDTACSQIYAHASFRFFQEFGFRVSLLFALLWPSLFFPFE